MIVINPNSSQNVLQLALSSTLNEAVESKDPELVAETSMLIRIEKPEDFALDWRHSPDKLSDLLNHLPNKRKVAQDLYDHYIDRLNNKKIDDISNLIRKSLYTKRAVLNVWDNNDLFSRKGSACVNYYWFRVIGEYIECHSHMRACNIYTKLSANLAISCDLHISLANSLSLKASPFLLFIDCAHIYKKDYELVNKIVREEI